MALVDDAFFRSAYRDSNEPGIRYPKPPTGSESIETAFDTVYTWDYTVQRPELRNLYEKSKDAQWNARTLLAWDTNVDPEAPTMPNEMIPIYGTELWDKLDK